MADIVARLEMEGPGGTRSIPIELGGVCSIGRGTQNTIMLEDSSVSRKHAIIDCQSSNDCHVTDAGSSNGTFVNDVRVAARTRLRHGDSLRIGEVPMRVLFAETTQINAQSMAASPTVVITSARYVTVLVGDIRDFTGLTRRVGEKRVSDVIREFTRLAGEELDQAGAATQKYIGDAVMGVWDHGPDPPRPDDVMPALLTASRLFRIIAPFQQQFGLDDPVRIGAALNTGRAIVGNLGSRVAADYTALGDSINKAFRLETASKQVNLDLVIGSSTWSFLSPELQACFEPCVFSLKGYEQPEVAYGTSIVRLNSAAPMRSVPQGKNSS
jgi:adenylate cyclase